MLLLLCRQVRALGGTIAPMERPASYVSSLSVPDLTICFVRQIGMGDSTPISVSLRRRIDAYPTHQVNGYPIRIGRPYPMGATSMDGGINFAIYSRHATAVSLVLFATNDAAPAVEIPFPR